LHCRHAARIAARDKRKRLMLRGGAVAIVVALFIAAGTLGTAAIRGRFQRGSGVQKAPEPTVVADASIPENAPLAAPADSMNGAPPVTQEGLTRPPMPIAPVIPIGQSSISDGVTALRADSAVTLSFDSPMIRTRIPEKFERFVRTTLPAIYGHGVDSVLAKIPDGGIASQGDLMSELPARGVRIPVGTAWMLQLFPEVRPGQDGPLVVRYRVAVVPAGQ
jgi:hypothetical protein